MRYTLGWLAKAFTVLPTKYKKFKIYLILYILCPVKQDFQMYKFSSLELIV